MGKFSKQALEWNQDLISRVNKMTPAAVAKASPYYYTQIPTEIRDIHFEWSFYGEPISSFGLELHFESPEKNTNLAMIKKFESYKAEIEKATGEQVTFQEKWQNGWTRLFIVKHNIQLDDNLKVWAAQKMALMFKVLHPRVKALNG